MGRNRVQGPLNVGATDSKPCLKDDLQLRETGCWLLVTGYRLLSG